MSLSLGLSEFHPITKAGKNCLHLRLCKGSTTGFSNPVIHTLGSPPHAHTFNPESRPDFALESRIPTIYEKLTVSFIAAEAKITCRRLFQLVNIMSTAIPHLDRNFPAAAVVTPMETYLPIYYSVFLLRVLAVHPSGSVGPTALGRNTGVGNLGSGVTNKLVPFSDCF